ncbi:phosphatases II [Obba rivulosa]|uniref:Phosphatases II n=1 Tax=Obba rivulosa TaxID=1052685 RepID=A0A8E2DJ94_9APHY|nr:phosphatases II [Obba rivulosa]
MDAIRVAKVEGVLCSQGGVTSSGTLHLTAHHLIFHHDDSEREEMWVPYPLISLVTHLPLTLQGNYSLTIRTRTFETSFLTFASEKDASDVFESVKDLTVAASVNQLYAFHYVPNPSFTSKNGWTLYSPREEFGRMGVGTRTRAWRFTDINKDYSFSPTYPAKLVVPTRISDATLQYAAKYRSKARIPVLTYLHWANYGSITRSSQPMVGLTNNRSIQDEKLIEAVFQSHHSPESRVSAGPVYGATATNLIIDARPTTNAMANTAKGAGTENMDHYKDAKKAYLGIDHIHVMRESLAKVVEALRETEVPPIGVAGDQTGEGTVVPVLDRQALRRSGWLRHISAILEGSVLIVRNVHVNSSHVLIHCSDGWDRTAQLSSISQLCLDPFYRTTRGFQILIEKDWLSFGHKFLDRCGYLSSEKFFLAPTDNPSGGAEAAQAFLASVQNRFASQQHIKETSPVFHQFLECVRQIQRQFPERFEFNERFLRRLYYHLCSCQFGTFLLNCERERRVSENGGPPLSELTVSVWDFFNSEPELALNRNPDYDPSLDDPAHRVPKADMGVLIPNPKDVRFWHELYGRTDEEMNGRFITKQAAQEQFVTPVEGTEDDPSSSQAAALGVPLPPSPTTSPSPGPTSPALARLALDRSNSPTPQGHALSETRRTRHESLRGFDGSSSRKSHNMLGVPPRTPSPGLPGTRSPTSPRPAVSELFSSGGMRSMWGKLSSNASAALSVVQGAYDGVAKDFRGLSVGEQGQERGGELRSREEIAAWGAPEDPEAPASPCLGVPHTVGASAGTNPWATTRVRPAVPPSFLEEARARAPPSVPSEILENPWSMQPQARSQSDSVLPRDPTVELPESVSSTSSRSSTLPGDGGGALGLSPLESPLGAESQPRVPTPPASRPPLPPPASSDPLGVGLL